MGSTDPITNGRTHAEDALQNCVTVETEPGETYPDQFFEAEVSGISRHAAGTLLNEDAVRSYISEVCPVPMSQLIPDSPQKLTNSLATMSQLLTSQIVTVNDDPQPVHRQYGPSIKFSDSRTD